MTDHPPAPVNLRVGLAASSGGLALFGVPASTLGRILGRNAGAVGRLQPGFDETLVEADLAAGDPPAGEQLAVSTTAAIIAATSLIIADVTHGRVLTAATDRRSIGDPVAAGVHWSAK